MDPPTPHCTLYGLYSSIKMFNNAHVLEREGGREGGRERVPEREGGRERESPTHRVEYMADGPELKGEVGQRPKNGSIERLDQL